MPRPLPAPCRSPAHGLLMALALVCAPHTMGMGSQPPAPEQSSHTPAMQRLSGEGWKRQFKIPGREAVPSNHHDDKVDSDQTAVCLGEGGAMHMRGGGCFGFGVRQFIDTRRVPAPVRWPEPPESERAAPRVRSLHLSLSLSLSLSPSLSLPLFPSLSLSRALSLHPSLSISPSLSLPLSLSLSLSLSRSLSLPGSASGRETRASALPRRALGFAPGPTGVPRS